MSDEIDELKNLPVRDADEEIFELRERYEQLHADWKTARNENDALRREIDQRQSLIQRHEFEMQQQVETVAYLNQEVSFPGLHFSDALLTDLLKTYDEYDRMRLFKASNHSCCR